MGNHQRFITKDNIIENIFRIDDFLDGENLLYDEWSNRFKDQINIEERGLRNSIKEKMLLNGGCADQHYGYGELISYSECLISLLTDPCWLDVHFTKEKIGIELKLEEMGNFDIQVDKCIVALTKYFEKK
jgi:hypothetical protein